MLEINALVPDFSLMGSDNNEHKLSEYRGKNIVLYLIAIGIHTSSIVLIIARILFQFKKI